MGSVSVICVFNDRDVRERCLDHSLQERRHEAADLEYLPVDNTAGAFPSAGAALNHAARAARNDYLVFVHQDVYVHSVAALVAVADLMSADPTLAMCGPVGVDGTGRVVGQIRDRVVLIGDPAPGPADVDSLDEVLFVISREQVLREPLTEAPELAWHAYAVEYAARVRAAGLRVAAVDVPITHNSLTINLARLAEAHAAVADRHPDVLPLRTTCGTVRRRRTGPRAPAFVDRHRWRRRWALESWEVQRLGALLPDARLVLGDIRRDVDDVLGQMAAGRLVVVNLDTAGRFREPSPQPLQLRRRAHEVSLASCRSAEVLATIAGSHDDEAVLLTNLTPDALLALAPVLDGREAVLGVHGGIGAWTLLGAAARVDVAAWRSGRGRPFALPQGANPARGPGQRRPVVLRQQITEARRPAGGEQDR